MIHLQSLLRVEDEFSLFLVAHSVKPCASLHLTPMSEMAAEFSDCIRNETCTYEGDAVLRRSFDPCVVRDFRDHLHSCGLQDCYFEQLNSNEEKMVFGDAFSTKKLFSLDYDFYVGPTLDIANNLVRFPLQRGYLLGYPFAAVESFLKPFEGVQWDVCAMAVQLTRARNAGIEIPSWFPYLGFLPEPFDLVAGRMCEESRKIGQRNEYFTRLYNPDLAMRLEAEQKWCKHPVAWKVVNGCYELTYEKSVSGEDTVQFTSGAMIIERKGSH